MVLVKGSLSLVGPRLFRAQDSHLSRVACLLAPFPAKYSAAFHFPVISLWLGAGQAAHVLWFHGQTSGLPSQRTRGEIFLVLLRNNHCYWKQCPIKVKKRKLGLLFTVQV